MPDPTSDYPYNEPRTINRQTCGSTDTIILGHGDNRCPTCGQWYNSFGQTLRSDWQGNPSTYDENIDDLTGAEMYEIAHDL